MTFVSDFQQTVAVGRWRCFEEEADTQNADRESDDAVRTVEEDCMQYAHDEGIRLVVPMKMLGCSPLPGKRRWIDARSTVGIFGWQPYVPRLREMSAAVLSGGQNHGSPR